MSDALMEGYIMYRILNQINEPNDIKNIAPTDYRELTKEIRTCLVRDVSRTGGHLASNLGVVELTIALHLCLEFPEDKLIWDVGHQSYVHKILTGRWRELESIRQYGGISGFPKMKESCADAFDTGHASTSVSAALGYAFSRQMQGKDNKVFAVIGDGSMTGGLFFEALNNAVSLKSNMVIVLNDNNMSISKNVGAMSRYLTKIRTASQYQNLKENIEDALRKMPGIGDAVVDKVRRSKSSIKHLMIPGMLFEDMGLTYIGPVDGHNIGDLVTTFQNAMKLNEPVIVHVKTIKGKGYKLAEANPSFFHGVEPFNIRNGKPRQPKPEGSISYTDVFGRKLCEMADKNEKIVAVCAAMPLGTGLMGFSKEFKNRFFDVGIAEEHAVTFSAALAADGMIPVVAIYSTFLQRAYDQILHDVCQAGLHVVFAIDRSGIVGNDGETHQGIYDISYLSSIPGLEIMAPKNADELSDMMEYAINECKGPVAIRYPRGCAYTDLKEYRQKIESGKAELIHDGSGILMLALGSMTQVGESLYQELIKSGTDASLVNLRFAKPFDYDLLENLINKHEIIVTLEENALSGGMSEQVASYLQWNGYTNKKCLPVSLPDVYIEHGAPDLLKEKYGLGVETILNRIRGMLQ